MFQLVTFTYLEICGCIQDVETLHPNAGAQLGKEILLHENFRSASCFDHGGEDDCNDQWFTNQTNPTGQLLCMNENSNSEEKGEEK